MKSLAAIAGVWLISSACGSLNEGSAAGDRTNEAGPAAVEATVSSPPGGAREATGVPSRAPAAASGAGADLAIWHDADFKRRFAESYLAESEVEPPVTAAERDQLIEIFDRISDGKLGEATELLEASNAKTASAAFDFTLGSVHFQQERLEPAMAAYQAAIDKHPKFRRAWRNLGLAQVRANRLAEAIASLTRLVELGGGDAIVYGLLGFAYSSVADHVAAESAYRLAILLDGKTADWKLGLARCFFEQERFADAVALCDAMIAKSADQPELWLLQANAYLGLGKPLEAAESYEIVDRLGASTAETLNTLGDIYVNEALFDLAVGCYLRAMDKDAAARPERWLRAAKVLTARGALQESGALLERVEALHGSKLGPDERKDMLRLRARLAVAEGKGQEQARLLEEVVALDPLDGQALLLLGLHHARSNDPEKAVFYYERAASLEAFEADAKVRHAQLLVGQGKYAAALPLLRRAQAIAPRDNVQQYLEQVERVAAGK